MTKTNKQLAFKIADEDWEHEAIHSLNYKTFVDEIPQHLQNKACVLVDKFHDQNTYIICTQESKLLGMLAVRDQRPFSLDSKLSNLDTLLPRFKKAFEIRLLAVPSKYRNTFVFQGLLQKAFSIAYEKEYDIALISGTIRQTKLYSHIGFKPFAHQVGSKDALYQPMYLTLKNANRFLESSNLFRRDLDMPHTATSMRNYLPGPVSVSKKVLEANSAMPISHRNPSFIMDFKKLQKKLCAKFNIKKVYILSGSGTLANDIIAAQLSGLKGKGLILNNGEFGQRLENHALHAGLDYDTYRVSPGDAFDTEHLSKITQQPSNYTWLWLTHCETSTGVLNDLSAIQVLCTDKGIKLCLDCISTVGCYPLDLSRIYLASATSGKGLASLPGLALIFTQPHATPKDNQLPRYFDLTYYDENKGIPFTISSNAMYALSTALDADWGKQQANAHMWSKELCDKLDIFGLNILAQPKHRAYHVITITLPQNISSQVVGKALARAGYLISYQSIYLVKNNWVQICFMGQTSQLDSIFYAELQRCLIPKLLPSPPKL